MKHIKQLLPRDFHSLFGKVVTTHGNIIQVDKETIWMGLDFSAELKKDHDRFVVIKDNTTKLKIYLISRTMFSSTVKLTEKYIIENGTFLYEWDITEIDPDQTFDVPDALEFVLQKQKFSDSAIGSYYGAPTINCATYGRACLCPKGKYEVMVTNDEGEVMLSGEEVSIVATSSSGGGHGEGHWDSGFGFSFPFGIVMPKVNKESRVVVYADTKDISFY